MVDMDDIPHWSINHTVLLGDACHPVSPFGFSGASMAIEDAVTLSALLPRDVNIGDINGRLGLYQDIRRERVGRVRETARTNAIGDNSKGMAMDYMRFLSEHDAVGHAEQALAEHLGQEGRI